MDVTSGLLKVFFSVIDSLAALCRRLIKNSGKLACHMLNWNNAVNFFLWSKYRWVLWRNFERFMMESRFLLFSLLPLFLCTALWEHCVYWCSVSKQLLYSNNRNRVCWSIFGISQDGVCTDLFENFSVNSLKQGLSNDATLKIHDQIEKC